MVFFFNYYLKIYLFIIKNNNLKRNCYSTPLKYYFLFFLVINYFFILKLFNIKNYNIYIF